MVRHMYGCTDNIPSSIYCFRMHICVLAERTMHAFFLKSSDLTNKDNIHQLNRQYRDNPVKTYEYSVLHPLISPCHACFESSDVNFGSASWPYSIYVKRSFYVLRLYSVELLPCIMFVLTEYFFVDIMWNKDDGMSLVS